MNRVTPIKRAAPTSIAPTALSIDPVLSSLYSGHTELGLHNAVSRGDIGSISYALSGGQSIHSVAFGLQPVHIAATLDDPTVLEFLLQSGADINAQTVPRASGHPLPLALHTAGPMPSIALTRKHHNHQHQPRVRSSISYIREFGTSAISGPINFTTGLYSMQMGHGNNNTMYNSGNPLFPQDSDDLSSSDPSYHGATPLHFAVANHCTDVVCLLLRSGAKIDTPDSYGNTPESVARARNDDHIVHMLQVERKRRRIGALSGRSPQLREEAIDTPRPAQAGGAIPSALDSASDLCRPSCSAMPTPIDVGGRFSQDAVAQNRCAESGDVNNKQHNSSGTFTLFKFPSPNPSHVTCNTPSPTPDTYSTSSHNSDSRHFEQQQQPGIHKKTQRLPSLSSPMASNQNKHGSSMLLPPTPRPEGCAVPRLPRKSTSSDCRDLYSRPQARTHSYNVRHLDNRHSFSTGSWLCFSQNNASDPQSSTPNVSIPRVQTKPNAGPKFASNPRKAHHMHHDSSLRPSSECLGTEKHGMEIDLHLPMIGSRNENGLIVRGKLLTANDSLDSVAESVSRSTSTNSKRERSYTDSVIDNAWQNYLRQTGSPESVQEVADAYQCGTRPFTEAWMWKQAAMAVRNRRSQSCSTDTTPKMTHHKTNNAMSNALFGEWSP